MLDVEFGTGELGCPVDGDEEVEFTLPRPDRGDGDVKSADRVALERRALRLVALGVWQAGDAVALEAAVRA